MPKKTSLFTECNSNVPRRMLETTAHAALSNIFGPAHYPSLVTRFVGNNNQAEVGDIDVAVQLESLMFATSFHSSPFAEDFWDHLKVWFERKSPYEFAFNKGFRQVSFLVPLIEGEGEHRKQAWAEEDGLRVMPLDVGQVQLDLLVGDVKWMENFLSGPGKGSSYKALYRNSLIKATVSRKHFHSVNGVQQYCCVDYRNGIKHRIYNETTKQRIDSQGTNCADVMAQMFFNAPDWESINSFEKVFAVLTENDWFDKKENILKAFITDIKSQKVGGIPLPISKEMLEYMT